MTCPARVCCLRCAPRIRATTHTWPGGVRERWASFTRAPENPQLDSNGFPIYEPGQEARLFGVSGARPDERSATRLDPHLENGFSRQALVYIERELVPDVGLRTGFVWNGGRQIYGQAFAHWPLDDGRDS